MDVHELSRDQLTELKGNYICEKNEERGEGTSWGEIADADEIISDAEIFEAYAGYEFGNDDFSCTAGISEDLFDADERTVLRSVRQCADRITLEDIERNASIVCAV